MNKLIASVLLAVLFSTCAAQAQFTPPAGGGTVSSVTFTGDGTVLSSTPSTAVTTSGSVPASLLTTSQYYFLGRSASGIGAPSYQQIAFSFLSGNITAAQMLALSSAYLYVGNGSNVPAAVAVSGDLTLANTGAFTIANSAVTVAKMANVAAHSYLGNNTSSAAAPAAITSAQLTADLNVATDTLQGVTPALATGQIYVGKTSSAIQSVSPSGDIASISNTGAFTLKTLGTGAGSCTLCSATYDANGRETAYANGTAVTGFSSGNLSPLFTTSVATSTTTPAQTFALSTASANTALRGPASGSAAAPTYRQDVLADLPLAYTHPEQCRITLTSGSPYASADVTGATNFYVDPAGGSIVTLPDSTGNNFTPLTFSEITTAVPSAIFRLYDIFLSNSSGSAAVTTTAWDSGGQTTGTITGVSIANPPVLTATNTLSSGQFIAITGVVGTAGTDSKMGLNGRIFKVASATGSTITLETGNATTGLAYTSGGTFYLIPTARTTSLTQQNGIYLQTGNLNRVYIGTIMAGVGGTSGTTEDSGARRDVWNYFNRAQKTLFNTYTGSSSHAYSTATVHPFDAGIATSETGTRTEFVFGIAEDPVQITQLHDISNTAASNEALGAVDLDSVSAFGFADPIYSQVASVPVFGSGVASSNPAIGSHFWQETEYASGGTMTWYSNNGNADTVSIFGRW